MSPTSNACLRPLLWMSPTSHVGVTDLMYVSPTSSIHSHSNDYLHERYVVTPTFANVSVTDVPCWCILHTCKCHIPLLNVCHRPLTVMWVWWTLIMTSIQKLDGRTEGRTLKQPRTFVISTCCHDIVTWWRMHVARAFQRQCTWTHTLKYQTPTVRAVGFKFLRWRTKMYQ